MLVLTRTPGKKVRFKGKEFEFTLTVASMSEQAQEATFAIDGDALTEAMIKADNGPS